MADQILPDHIPGTPHPRQTSILLGHEAAERQFLDAWRGERLAHAWLLHGQRGIGKATLGYRIARFLIRGELPEGDSLAIPTDDNVAMRVVANSEKRLRVLRREWDKANKRPFTRIRVEDVRALSESFHLSNVVGGWRVAIVDAAEEMTDSAANALLKTLEEPPPLTLLILLSHAPHRLLPTIRSRCRALALHPLAWDDLLAAVRAAIPAITPAQATQVARASGGSVGEAASLFLAGGAEVLPRVTALLAGLPTLDREALSNLVDELAPPSAVLQREIAVRATENLLAELARAAAVGRKLEDESMARLAPLVRDPAQGPIWADASRRFRQGIQQADAVNINPAASLVVGFTGLEQAARDSAAIAP